MNSKDSKMLPTFDLYRGEVDTDKVWNLREIFIQSNHGKLPESKLVCLSYCFSNHELYGCRYPTGVMKQLDELTIGLSEIAKQRNFTRSGKKMKFVKASTSKSDQQSLQESDEYTVIDSWPAEFDHSSQEMDVTHPSLPEQKIIMPSLSFVKSKTSYKSTDLSGNLVDDAKPEDWVPFAGYGGSSTSSYTSFETELTDTTTASITDAATCQNNSNISHNATLKGKRSSGGNSLEVTKAKRSRFDVGSAAAKRSPDTQKFYKICDSLKVVKADNNISKLQMALDKISVVTNCDFSIVKLNRERHTRCRLQLDFINIATGLGITKKEAKHDAFNKAVEKLLQGEFRVKTNPNGEKCLETSTTPFPTEEVTQTLRTPLFSKNNPKLEDVPRDNTSECNYKEPSDIHDMIKQIRFEQLSRLPVPSTSEPIVNQVKNLEPKKEKGPTIIRTQSKIELDVGKDNAMSNLQTENTQFENPTSSKVKGFVSPKSTPRFVNENPETKVGVEETPKISSVIKVRPSMVANKQFTDRMINTYNDVTSKLSKSKRKKSRDNTDDKNWGDLSQFIILEHVNDVNSATSVLCRSADFNKMPLTYEFVKVGDKVRCNLSINGVSVVECVGLKKVDVKTEVSENALQKLRQVCYTITIKKDVDGKDTSITRETVMTTIAAETKDAIPDSNIGSRLLRKMGWVSGGIGKEGNKGIVEPVEAGPLIINRQGLGMVSDKDFTNSVKETLLKYAKSNNPGDIALSTEFSKEERALIHKQARTLGLKSHSIGKGDDRHLVISRKRSANQLFDYVASSGGETDKYQITEPSCKQM